MIVAKMIIFGMYGVHSEYVEIDAVKKTDIPATVVSDINYEAMMNSERFSRASTFFLPDYTQSIKPITRLVEHQYRHQWQQQALHPVNESLLIPFVIKNSRITKAAVQSKGPKPQSVSLDEFRK
ncbi:hypothetical protein OnM2_022100 [Erysiphe neolycopersici]|uniref:Uncharacterized protein n=1 Tax=Erysiphe neolycopersici TaxID=212602 RepID=A0A420I2M8_9PEZI|nr:hypothetical protein OnM2_022100 [Erysiphe neolycopersici]